MAGKKVSKSQARSTADATGVHHHRAASVVAWLMLAAFAGFIIASLFSFDRHDWPTHLAYPANWPVTNWCGAAGALIAYHSYALLGLGVWLLPIAFVVYLLATLFGRRVRGLIFRVVGLLLAAVAVSSLLHLWSFNPLQMPEGPGGLLAIYAMGELMPRFGIVGTHLAAGLVLLVALALISEELLLWIPPTLRWILRRGASAGAQASRKAGHAVASAVTSGESEQPESPTPVYRGGQELTMSGKTPRNRIARILRKLLPFTQTADIQPAIQPAPAATPIQADTPEESVPSADAATKDQSTNPTDKESTQAAADESLREKMARLPLKIAQPLTMSARDQKKAAKQAMEPDLSGYQFPSMDVLAEPEEHLTDEITRTVRIQAEVLEKALQTYNIGAEVVAIDSGPVITLYEISLTPGTKVSQINSLSSDLARELKAQSIRIVPNTAGKSTVGIEVPNLTKEKVRMKELIHASAEQASKMALPMFLGKDASGTPLVQDLAAMPHMLIAGTTGSGKSVCINTILMSWLFTRRPDQLKVCLIDPKMVEMSQFKTIPHLMCPVETDMSKAAAILEWAVAQMDERYELLAEAGVRDIDAYNKLGWEELKERLEPSNEEEEARIPKQLPRLVFMIDELADLMLTNRDVEGFIVRIAQKARAVGIHLILATQRPQANVVTGLIKSNMPCRVSFKVASGMDSRIVLDAKGAELLLGHGDMLYLSPRTSRLTRAQGTFVEDTEIRQTVRFLKDVAEQNFVPQLTQIRTGAAGGAPGDADEEQERDELFEDAVHVVLETQRGSVSLLQRRLTIGYARASRLIEQIAEAGLLGPYKGSQAREVLYTLDEYEQMQNELAQQSAAIHTMNETEAENLGETSWDK